MERQRQHTTFLGRLDKWPSERLFTVERQVRDTMETPGYRELLDLISEATADAEARLKYGPVQEQAQYARSLGYISGMECLPAVAEAVLMQAEVVAERLKRQAGDPAEA